LDKSLTTRRNFLKQSLFAGAGIVLPSACGISGRDTVRIDATAIKRLQSNFNGQLIQIKDDIYDTARSVYWRNAMTDKRPVLIAKCVQPNDVTQSIEFAEDQNLLLAIKGGGHSFVGWGTCDDGLVIDMSPMKEIVVDPENRTVRAGAGVVTRELVAATIPHNLVPVLGQCPSVGIAGLTLGGGLGWLSGKYGATCDNLLSAQIVTADGRTLTCSSEQHSDLFWAIRGGGGNFGVATSFTYALHPIGNVIAGRLSFRFNDADRVLQNFADIMGNAPDALQATASLKQGEEALVNIQLCWSGDQHPGDEIIRQLRTVATPILDTVREQNYIDTFNQGNPSRFSATKGTYLQHLTDETIEVVLESFKQAPGPGAAIGLDHYMHGAVCRVASNSTAFELRAPDALHVWVQGKWGDPASESQFLRWIDDTWNTLQDYSAGRVYANYPAAVGNSVAKAVYSESYARLVETKNKYDPSNVFRRNYNIKPSLG